MPVHVVMPFYELLFAERLGELEEQLDLSELRWAAGRLWSEYMGIAARSEPDAEVSAGNKDADEVPSPASQS